jgi:hypothetical protein
MRPRELPYAWFDTLIEGAQSVFRSMVEMETLPNTEINAFELGGDTYAPATTLTWRAQDGVSRNIHFAVVAPDDAGFLVPGSKAVTEANAWLDATDQKGVVTRRQLKFDVDRKENLEEAEVAAYVVKMPMIFWQGYGVAKLVERSRLERSGEEQKSPEKDPGPIGLEQWLGE